MDITNETNLDRLKALAYDQLSLLQATQQNINIIEQRIKAVEAMPKIEKPEPKETTEEVE